MFEELLRLYLIASLRQRQGVTNICFLRKLFIFLYIFVPLFSTNFASATNYFNMGRLGVTEILIILLVVLLLFGGKKIPELMKGLGSGIKEFKNAAKDDQPAEKKSEETK
jgi:sec-independent protein translocase protein TatA